MRSCLASFNAVDSASGGSGDDDDDVASTGAAAAEVEEGARVRAGVSNLPGGALGERAGVDESTLAIGERRGKGVAAREGVVSGCADMLESWLVDGPCARGFAQDSKVFFCIGNEIRCRLLLLFLLWADDVQDVGAGGSTTLALRGVL